MSHALKTLPCFPLQHLKFHCPRAGAQGVFSPPSAPGALASNYAELHLSLNLQVCSLLLPLLVLPHSLEYSPCPVEILFLLYRLGIQSMVPVPAASTPLGSLLEMQGSPVQPQTCCIRIYTLPRPLADGSETEVRGTPCSVMVKCWG